MRNFEEWLKTFRQSIATYEYYVDFDKVYSNVDAIKIPLNILNSLIGSRNIENEFISILNRYPETLRCIPILIAKRELEIVAMDGDGLKQFNFKDKDCTPEEYASFMRKTVRG